MKNARDLKYLHNVMWISHGLLAVLCGLLLIVVEPTFKEAIAYVKSQNMYAQLTDVFIIIELLFVT